MGQILKVIRTERIENGYWHVFLSNGETYLVRKIDAYSWVSYNIERPRHGFRVSGSSKKDCIEKLINKLKKYQEHPK